MQIRRAQKSIAKLRIGLAGPSGSGKTYSALLLASGITKWENICVIDTERQSADLYSDLGPYNVITLETPFSPQKYIEAIQAAEAAGMEVIIVDSITHEWSEAKNMVDKLGGRFQDWAKVTPIHDRFIDALVSSKAHVITTVRSKTDYSMTTEGGKTKVQKVGLKAEQRDGFEYELTVSFDLNINHMAETSKDRTALYMDADPFVISEQTGKKLLNWANTGLNPQEIVDEIAELLPTKDTEMTIGGLESFYKVNSLAEVSAYKLQVALDKLKQLPDKPKEVEEPEPENEEESGSDNPFDNTPKSAKSGDSNKKVTKDVEIDVDEIDKGIEDQRKREQEAAKPVSSGDLKLIEVMVARSAEKRRIAKEAVLEPILKDLNVAKVNDLNKDQAKIVTNRITEENAKFDAETEKITGDVKNAMISSESNEKGKK